MLLIHSFEGGGSVLVRERGRRFGGKSFEERERELLR